MLLSDICGQ